MFKVKALHTFRDKNKKMIPKGKIFETDDQYANSLVDYKLIEVISIVQEKPKEVIKEEVVKTKAKEVYKKKIIEPEKNKELNPITTDQFKSIKRKYVRRRKSNVSL